MTVYCRCHGGGELTSPPALGAAAADPRRSPDRLSARRLVAVAARTVGRAADAWPVLHEALGLDRHPSVGHEVTLRPDGPDPITGVVDVASPEFLGVRSAHGLHRIGAEGDEGCGVDAYHYFYGDPADDERPAAAWREWLTRLFPAPA